MAASKDPLHTAAELGDVDKVRELLEECTNVNCEDTELGKTPLHYACEKGRVAVVRELLKFKARLSKRDYDGYYPLHYACLGGHLSVLRILVSESNVDLTALDGDDRTALMLAARGGHKDLVLALLHDYHCPVTGRDINGWTVLHHACVGGSINVVQTLIHKHKADVNVRNEYDETPLHLSTNSEVVCYMINIIGCDCNEKALWGCTLLHYACKSGAMDIVRVLIHDCKADVNIRDEHGDMPLHVAAEAGQFEVALALVSEFGCDPDAVGSQGYTLLHYACKQGAINVVRALICDYKADVNVHDNRKEMPLHLAAKAGHYEIALALVSEFGGDPNTVFSNGYRLLHYVCKKGAINIVCALIRNCKADINVRDEHEDTPLHVAAKAGHYKIVHTLVTEFGCDPNAVGSKGYTLLHYACKRGAMDMVRTLIHDWKADIDARDKNKDTPLHVAAKEGHFDIALALVSDFGCDPNSVLNYGCTLLHYACKSGAINIVRALIRDCKADVNVYDKHNYTPLHVAAGTGHYEVALALVREFGCDSNAGLSYGYTLLHYACKSGAIDIVRALIRDCKADVNVRDEYNHTPLHVAAVAGNFEIAIALVSEFGCDPNAVFSDGNTLLHYACESGAIGIVRALICDCKADVNVRNRYYHMPLHVAAKEGQHKVALALVSEFGCDPNAQGQFGRTALHVASYHGRTTTVKTLLKFTSPLLTDIDGDTPLHLAASEDNIGCVRSLVHANATLQPRNILGQTPADVACGVSKSYITMYTEKRGVQVDYFILLVHAIRKYSGSHHITRVFVLGNPGAGKSSFIESLKREGFFQSFFGVSSVPPHTAGIIPSVHMSKEYGRVLFYDFAGDVVYYSSHAAIFESLAASRKGENIFIVVVDLRVDSATIETILHYWLTFIQNQKFNNSSLIVVGSHADLSTHLSEKGKLLDQFCSVVYCRAKHFILDCRDPRSSQIAQFKKHILSWVSESQKYEISFPALLLLGLLVKDFSAVTACPVQALVSHISHYEVWLPVETKSFHQLILELHEVGVLLLLGDYTKDYYHVILNISKLTNEVHELLFSESAVSSITKAHVSFNTTPLNIGIIPESLLAEILPPYITKECLIHLQYCQQISHSDVGFFSSLEQADSSSQSFLFFPALCSVDKSQVFWNESTGNSFSMGWLALCTNPHDYFPPRFLHVLLLRLVYTFTLSPEPVDPLTTHASRRCTMWKKGVHWSMEEGVDCMVELVEGSKGVVVRSKSSPAVSEDCFSVFTRLVSCVMDTKAEFCYSIKPQFFLLGSTAEADYLNKENRFPVRDVERALAEGKPVVISMGHGRGKMELSKLQFMHKFTHWHSLFPIGYKDVLHTLQVVVNKLDILGVCLGAPTEFLEKLQVNFPSDVDQRRIELIKWWMSSTLDLPCWWHLVQALKSIDENVLAEKLKNDYGVHILQLQEKLLSPETQALKPDEEFLYSLSCVVGSRWPSLAVSLSLREGETEWLKRKVCLSQQEQALQMLNIWSSKREASYGQLCCKLKAISLFQCST